MTSEALSLIVLTAESQQKFLHGSLLWSDVFVLEFNFYFEFYNNEILYIFKWDTISSFFKKNFYSAALCQFSLSQIQSTLSGVILCSIALLM